MAKALLSGPCLQQGSIHSEVLIGEQIPLSCLLEHGCEKSVGDVACKQTLPILREHRHIPNRIIHVQSHKPTEQQAVIELFHQHSFASHRVQHLEQQRTQQLLRCYRWPSSLGV